jgi:NAD-reducing hydrogenase small subunit
MAGKEHHMKSIRLATVWLSGCSGCHMSLLNIHEELLDILAQCELVYSPLMDIKEYPYGVDIVLVEGAVGNDDNREMAQIIRRRTGVVISLGDCAIHGNVSALRNPGGLSATLERSYGKIDWKPGLARLETQVLPLHQVIRVDAFIPGCPPGPALIRKEIIERFHHNGGKK